MTAYSVLVELTGLPCSFCKDSHFRIVTHWKLLKKSWSAGCRWHSIQLTPIWLVSLINYLGLFWYCSQVYVYINIYLTHALRNKKSYRFRTRLFTYCPKITKTSNVQTKIYAYHTHLYIFIILSKWAKIIPQNESPTSHGILSPSMSSSIVARCIHFWFGSIADSSSVLLRRPGPWALSSMYKVTCPASTSPQADCLSEFSTVLSCCDSSLEIATCVHFTSSRSESIICLFEMSLSWLSHREWSSIDV